MGFYLVSGATYNSRASLAKIATNIERLMRYSSDESTIRNSIIRLHFDLTEKNTVYALEYGPNDSFVLPPIKQRVSSQTLKEKSEEDKQSQELNSKFNRIPEFKDQLEEFPDDIRFLGLATSQYPTIIKQGHPAVYVYPSGERDGAILFLASEQEVLAITIHAFMTDIDLEYISLEEGSLDELNDKQDEVANQMLAKWRGAQ